MKRAFVVGHPIKHSRSPLIHGYWLKEHGLEGSYERVDVAPSAFSGFFKTLADQGFVGGNVTIPHKEAAFAAVARRTDRAERLKAVNTVWLEDGALWGDNTDILGFTAHLEHSLGASWDGGVETALVIGAGGAARAVAAGLLGRVKRILITNRTWEKAADLARDYSRGGSARVDAVAWERRASAVHGAQLIINATSLGMVGQPPLALDLNDAAAGSIVADVVYAPLKTALLAAAEERSLRTVDGLGMLLHQAVPGFARWFGVTPKVTSELRALIVADIEATR